MATKIFAGLVAAIALTGVGIYAATGSVPGVESVAELITPAQSGGCHQSSGCPLSASVCPSMAASCDSDAVVSPSAALMGGVIVAVTATTLVTAGGCCSN